MQQVYILTTYTGTVLSCIIKRVTKVEYAHVSIGLDSDLNEVYSFGRKHVSNPLFAGFVREYIDDGLYKKMVNTKCKVYVLDVTDEQYDKIRKKIDYFILNKKRFKYDALALVKLLSGNPSENRFKFVCSQFVAYVLEEGGVKLLSKPSNMITPKDFLNLTNIKVEYEGLLSEYRKRNENKKRISH